MSSASLQFFKLEGGRHSGSPACMLRFDVGTRGLLGFLLPATTQLRWSFIRQLLGKSVTGWVGRLVEDVTKSQVVLRRLHMGNQKRGRW